MSRIRCLTGVRNDAICEDPAFPHLDFFPDCQKWGNQREGQKLYRYIVFVTKFESSTVHQPAAIEVHARIYEHRPISSSFGRGSETET